MTALFVLDLLLSIIIAALAYPHGAYDATTIAKAHQDDFTTMVSIQSPMAAKELQSHSYRHRRCTSYGTPC